MRGVRPGAHDHRLEHVERVDVAKIEVTGVYPHGSYLRTSVTTTAQAGVYMPCPTVTAPALTER